MILDILKRSASYESIHPRFAAAFGFLHEHWDRFGDMADGRYEVDGERIYAMLASDAGRCREGAKLETHERYIDIQCALTGAETIGWEPKARCADSSGGYDASRDFELYSATPTTWLALAPGDFAVFFPEDAHAPLAGDGPVRKVVVKVAVGS